MGAIACRPNGCYVADLNILDNFKAIKFGRGVVSKNVLAFCAMIAGGTVLGWSTPDLGFKYVVFGVLAAYFLVTNALNVFFVSRHPESALVEGGEVVAFHRLEAEAKGLTHPSNDDAITTSPIRPLPAASVVAVEDMGA